MKNEIILTKETKVLLIEVLKRGTMTRKQAAEIIKPFDNHLTIEQAKEFLKKLENEY